jgi:hypothetical protein
MISRPSSAADDMDIFGIAGDTKARKRLKTGAD